MAATVSLSLGLVQALGLLFGLGVKLRHCLNVNSNLNSDFTLILELFSRHNLTFRKRLFCHFQTGEVQFVQLARGCLSSCSRGNYKFGRVLSR